MERMAGRARIKWCSDVDESDFRAGTTYLCLLYPTDHADRLTETLKQVETSTFAAKDILRASELALLPAKDPDVAKQLKKVEKGAKLSPLLLIRESGHARLIVADGFHRLCAVHHIDPDEQVPCKIA